MTDRVTCRQCGTSILAATASHNKGLCVPCRNGTRESIEAGKKYHREQREREASQRSRRKALGDSPTLGNYASDPDPMAILWPDLVNTVFRDGPREEHPEYLSPAARIVYWVGCFDGEVGNGGFSQFFSNSSGNWVPETLEALEQIGARLSLSLLTEAVSLFPGRAVPRDRRRRYALLSDFEERRPDFLTRLDETYYRDVQGAEGAALEDMNELLEGFLRRHAREGVLA